MRGQLVWRLPTNVQSAEGFLKGKMFDEKEAKETVDEMMKEKGVPEWLEKDKEEKDEKKKDFDLELFMSTDGKHTVRVMVKNQEARREAVKRAMEIYDYVVARYGTKQAQAVKEYSNGKKEVDKKTCPHTNVRFAQSKTEKNPGRWFKVCQDCGEFLGWQD